MVATERPSHSQAMTQSGAPVRCYWQDVPSLNLASNGEIPTEADIIVIGAGFAGLATACRIGELRPDAKILVLESETVGYGASGRNGGLVSPLAAPIWLAGALRNARQSDALALLYRKSHAAALWAKTHAEAAEIEPAILQIKPEGPLTSAGLNEVADVIIKSGIPIQQERQHGRYRDVLLQTYTIQPYKLTLGLAQYARRLGAQIVERARVTSVRHSATRAIVTLASGEVVSAKKVVVCTNAYSGSIALERQPPGKVVRNFMLATAPLTEAQNGALQDSRNFVVELNRKYIFYRQHAGRLVFGGIDKIGQPGSGDDFEVSSKVAHALQREIAKKLGDENALAIDYFWGGRFHMTATDLPVIEPCPVNPFVIHNVGYGGTGVALTLVLAPVAAALALDEPVDDHEAKYLYAVMTETRIPVRAGIKLAALVSRRLLREAFSPKY